MTINEPIINKNSYFQHSSGLYLPENFRLMTPKRPTAIDLFSGAGGFSLGFVKAGWDVIAALEMDLPSIHTYLCNLGAYPVQLVFIEDADRIRTEKYFTSYLKKVLKNKKNAFKTGDLFDCGSVISGSNRGRVAPDFKGVQWMFIGDAKKITGQKMLEIMGLDLGEVDCVMGGPPCQGFTYANRGRNTMDPRNSLVLDFARLVCEIQPKTMIMENVPGIINMNTPEGIPVIDAVCKILNDGEFGEYETLKKTLLSTAGCGAGLKKNKLRRPAPAAEERQQKLF